MKSLLEEHGEVFVYGIVSITFLVIIFSVCGSKWRQIIPKYNLAKSKNSSEFIAGSVDKYPRIEVEEIIYVEYQSNGFNPFDYARAKSSNGVDITASLKISGEVDTSTKGIYQLRCVVSHNQLTTTKYMNVIVE